MQCRLALRTYMYHVKTTQVTFSQELRIIEVFQHFLKMLHSNLGRFDVIGIAHKLAKESAFAQFRYLPLLDLFAACLLFQFFALPCVQGGLPDMLEVR